jgi:bla regulator protein BlaR1
MATAAVAQQQQPAKEFEVASIKLTKSVDDRMMVRLNPGGRWVGRNVPVTLLIQEGFDVRQSQISGGPSWMGSERFDIEAKPESSAGGAPSSEELSVMFQSLLTSRFHLQFHRETKDVPAYALVVSKTGIKMKESDVANAGAKPTISVGPNRFKAVGMPMQMLANTLSRYLGRLVVDETGLKGNYDVTLEWTPDTPPSSVAAPANDPLPAAGGGGPSIFTAVQEQLGLKLDSKKAPVQMLVIDRLDRPDPN